jgi:Cu+-exporting ATPase
MSERKFTLPVSGMTCASCVAHVEQALRGVKSVAGVAVNLATEKASVSMRQQALTEARGFGIIWHDTDLSGKALAVDQGVETGAQAADGREQAATARLTAFLFAVPVSMSVLREIGVVNRKPGKVRATQ